jgi:predicted amidophosphoribosyltransferase
VIGLFDDVLTTGAHFRAAAAALRQSLSDVRIVGFFIARRVPEAADFGEFEL